MTIKEKSRSLRENEPAWLKCEENEEARRLFLTPRSRGSVFFVRGRSPNKYFKQALNVRRGGGVNFLTPCTPTREVAKNELISISDA